MKVLIALLMSLVASVVNAEVPCAADPQANDARSCANAGYMVAYGQMSEALSLAVDELSALASSNAPYEHSVAILMEAQQFWSQYITKDCDVRFAADPIGVNHEIKFMACLTTHTFDRAKQLNRYVAELRIVQAFPHTKPPIPVSYNCAFTQAQLASATPQDACMIQVLAKRCNAKDSCLVGCLAAGSGDHIGGGCAHICRGGGTRPPWTEPDPPEAAACFSKKVEGHQGAVEIIWTTPWFRMTALGRKQTLLVVPG